jgi:hypothetical protein
MSLLYLIHTPFLISDVVAIGKVIDNTFPAGRKIEGRNS